MANSQEEEQQWRNANCLGVPCAEFFSTSNVIPDDFEKAEIVSNDLISNHSLATLDKCEEKFYSVMFQLNCIVTNWEKSGQGNDGLSWSKDVWGDNSKF